MEIFNKTVVYLNCGALFVYLKELEQFSLTKLQCLKCGKISEHIVSKYIVNMYKFR